MNALETLASAITYAIESMQHDRTRDTERFALYGYAALIEQELNRENVRRELASRARIADLSNPGFETRATINGKTIDGSDDLIDRVLFQKEQTSFVQMIALGVNVVSNDAGVHAAANNLLKAL